MKKIANFISSIMLCLICACLVVACKDTTIESMTVKDNTLNTTIYVGEILDTSKVVVVVTYKDKTTKEVQSVDLKFGDISTEMSGTQKLKITYEDFSIYVDINVANPAGTSDIVESFVSKLKTEHLSKKGTQVDKNIEFKETEKTHLTGDDNPLDLRIEAIGYDNEQNDVEMDVETNIIVEIWKNDAWVTLEHDTDDESIKYDKYIESVTNTTVDFTEDAVAKKFRLSVKLADSVRYNEGSFPEGMPTINFETEVVDGYNVYNAKDLSLFDNANQNGYWTQLKEEWGLSNVSVNALVLQDDITIRDEDVPANHFWTASEIYENDGITLKNEFDSPFTGEAVGSMKDNQESIYTRYVADDDNFQVYGNYFDINASKLTKSIFGSDTYEKTGKNWYVSDTEGQESYICTHKHLFKMFGVQKNNQGVYDKNIRDHEKYASQGKSKVQDINFIGNGPRSATPSNSGGIILLKARAVNFTAENTISKDFNIAWFTEYGYNYTGADVTGKDATGFYIAMEGNDKKIVSAMESADVECTTKNASYNFTNNKAYNSYNSIFYFWGAPSAVIENCECIGAGGPVIIADHISNGFMKHVPQAGEEETTLWVGGGASYIDVINSNLESLVNGQEPWFVTFGKEVTAAVSQFVSLDNLYATSGASKTNLKENHMNMILIYKHGKKEMASGGFSRGYCRLFDTRQDYENYYQEGVLADGSAYYGYDRSIDWTKTTSAMGKEITGQYSGPAALANLINMFTSSSPETARYENSSTGVSDDVASGNKDIYEGDYLNLYMSNGFGSIFQMFDRK
ncbi:MAG: hypothetical protein ACI4PF_05675 [Christensenellales bacterium]